MANATSLIDAALAQLEPIPAAPAAKPTDLGAQTLAELAQAQVRFGQLLYKWQHTNGWSQDDPKRIMAAAGLGAIAVHNSQWSDLANAKVTPKPKLFAALSALNNLVADQRWVTPATVPPAVRQRLQHARPLLTPEGQPWCAADFFDAFIGGC